MGRRQPPRAELLAAVIDGERPIQVGMDIDASAGVAAPVGAGPELQQRAVQLERIVLADRTPILEAANAIEMGGRGAPGWLGIRRRLGKAGIVAREKSIEDALGVGERAGLRKPQFDDEAVLEGAKETLDASLAFRGRGRDPADAQLMQRAPDLGGGDGALELGRPGLRGPGIAVEEAVAVGVGGDGDAIASDEAAQQQEVAVGIFDGTEDSGQDVAGGIVDGGMEDRARAAVLEPGMVTAVHLDEEAGLGHPLAPAAMARRTAFARTADAGGAQEPLHGLAGDVKALALGEQIGEVMIVDAGVDRAGQRQDPRADRVRDAPRGAAAAVAVSDGRGTMLTPAGEQTAKVTQREAQEPGGLSGAQYPVMDPRQDVQALMLPLGQGNCLPGHPPRVTDSLTR